MLRKLRKTSPKTAFRRSPVASATTWVLTRLLVVFAINLTDPAGFALAENGVDPLFASNDVLTVQLEAPITSIMRDRERKEYVPGIFQYEDEFGIAQQLDVGIRTRGNFRRQARVCRFAPLRLNFKKSQTDGTLFDNQDKLKLVTHCMNNSARYAQSVINEYLAYRVLNVLTELSFRARLLRITYVDTDKGNGKQENFAILLEHDNRLAKRIETPVLETGRIEFGDLDLEYANLISVFQYFIGNTDFSQIAGPPDEACCHNSTLFGVEGGRIVSIPYDFDMSGIVNAPHAQPNPRFRLRSVRQRLYRGRCMNNKFIPASVRQFFDKREQIYELILNENAKITGSRTTTRKFVDWFYATLSVPKKIERELLRKCI